MSSMSKIQPPLRVERLRAAMARGAIDAIILLKPENTYWLSGFNPIIYSKWPIVVLTPGREVLLVPAIREDLAREKSRIEDVRLYGAWTGRTSFAPTWEEAVHKVTLEFSLGNANIGVEKDFISANTYELLQNTLASANLHDVSASINECRAVKDSDEIANARIACEIAEVGMDAAKASLTLGKSELEASNVGLKAMMDYHEMRYPAVSLSDFGSLEGGKHGGLACWIMSGSRKFLNTAPSTLQVPQKGETASVLVWAIANGMHAELERTVCIGDVSEVEKKAIVDILEVRAEILPMFKPGVPLGSIYQVCIEALKGRGYKHFPARIGHTLGLGSHEPVSIAADSAVELKEGMIITIEPHIQLLPQTAATQFSDTLIITSGGYELLTKLPEVARVLSGV